MKLRILASVLGLLLFTTAAECKIYYGSNKQVGKYIAVNDIKIYYEIYGSGEPLVLLHGNSGSINAMEFQIPELSKKFKVIAIDSRAQGKSTDSDKEMTYALMAWDVSELIAKLGFKSVYIVGWSDGANVGLELALAHPQQVKKLVAIGANYTHENFMVPANGVTMDKDDPRLLKMMVFINNFKKIMRKQSSIVQKKLEDMMEKYPNITVEQLRQIKMPVLVVVGDHDAININQTISLFSSLPHAQLLMVPGASHLALVEQPALVNSEVIKFLSIPYRDINPFYFIDLLNK
jgi:pimeloyl-ACP methyl ester carboxylesterase